jgi:DNA (cytosine-5)-methyltransferase 1
LAEIGLDAEWHCIPASAVGAPHRRERVWIVANAASVRHKGRTDSERRRLSSQPERAVRSELGRRCEDVADAEGISRRARLRKDERARQQEAWGRPKPCDDGGALSNSDSAGRQQQRRAEPIPAEQLAAECGGWWESEPDVGRVAHGIPSRVDRLRCLGNAVVPQVVEAIGRAILDAEARMNA